MGDLMMDILMDQITNAMTPEVTQQAGVDSDAMSNAIGMLIPILTSALARNASSPDGARELSDALAKDHDGGLLDQLPDYLSNPDTKDGDAILGHVLGSRRQDAEVAVSRSTGLDPQQVAKIMAALAPIVLAYLGRQQREKQLDPDGLSDVLARERNEYERKPPSVLGGLAGMLDQDRDGDVTDDAARIGVKILMDWLNKE